MNETWGQWFRQNFDKILLFFAWLVILAFCMHLMHDRMDLANVAWGREAAGTVLGAFLGLVTGSRLAAHANSSPNNPPPIPKQPEAPHPLQ